LTPQEAYEAGRHSAIKSEITPITLGFLPSNKKKGGTGIHTKALITPLIKMGETRHYDSGSLIS
jgi:hypothetical protein